MTFPYRTLLPQKVDNLLVAGRCHSVTQMGAAVTRMGVTAMLMGEAAGRAAVLALNGGCAPRDVDVKQLRTLLLGNGAVLEQLRGAKCFGLLQSSSDFSPAATRTCFTGTT